MRVLGIETSCDETGVAVYDSEQGLLAEALYSQIELHADYGGVVPELASRDHVRKLVPLIEQVLADASLTRTDIDGIAYTSGPGLAGALLVGAAVGRSLAYAWEVPAIGVHHMEGHLLAPLLAADQENVEFPFVALLVSGGHTQLLAVRGIGDYELLGDTLDDAAGEAFDKAAKMMGLPYPGGPQIAQLAQKGQPERFIFPRPMTDRPGLDMSFSGLKTFCLNTLNKAKEAGTLDEQTKADIALAFEKAVAETLMIKCRRALQQTGFSSLVMAGGVSANKRLRQRLQDALARDARIVYPPDALCTDNGAMIAYAGCQRLMAGEQEPLTIRVQPRWAMNTLSVIR